MADSPPELPTDWERHGQYDVKTEPRGHGIIAVYVKGPASQVGSVDRAGDAYARRNLPFAPGMGRGAVSGGGEFTDGGATYIAQRTYATQPLPPRTD